VSLIRRLLLILFCITILGVAIMFANSKSTNKSVFGYRYYTILTASMSPKLQVGDIIFVKIVDADEINVGDIITFNPSKSGDIYLTHRVIEKLENYDETGVTCFKTKGDANEDPDEILIDEARVIGKETLCIRKMGYIIRFIQLRWYYVLIIVILFIVMLKVMGIYLELKSSEKSEDMSDHMEKVNKEK